MKIKFIFVWKTKNNEIASIEKYYFKCLSKYSKHSLIVTKDFNYPDVEKIKKAEWDQVIAKLAADDYVILLDVDWKHLDSRTFANSLDKFKCDWINPVYVIAWPYWASKDLINRADMLLSFWDLTFTHELIRPLLLEQIFRWFSILKGSWYHK